MIPLWMTTNSERKVQLKEKCFQERSEVEEVKFKSNVKGNDLTAGSSAKSAPTGMSAKQTSFTVTRTDVCYDYDCNPRKHTIVFNKKHPPS